MRFGSYVLHILLVLNNQTEKKNQYNTTFLALFIRNVDIRPKGGAEESLYTFNDRHS